MKPETYMKSLGKFIDSIDRQYSYEVPESRASYLLDLGYIELRRWTEHFLPPAILATLSMSGYFVTEEGRKAYIKWKEDIRK